MVDGAENRFSTINAHRWDVLVIGLILVLKEAVRASNYGINVGSNLGRLWEHLHLVVLTCHWLPKRLRNLHESILDLRPLLFIGRVFSLVADHVPVVGDQRGEGPSCPQVGLIKDWHDVVAELGLQVGVQILLVIGGVDEAVQAITVVPVVVQENYLDFVLLAILEELRVKSNTVAVKHGFIQLCDLVSVNYQLVYFRPVIINKQRLLLVSVDELCDGPAEVALALQEGHLDLISDVREHALSYYSFFLRKVFYLLRRRVLILIFNQRFIETLLYLFELGVFAELLSLLLFNHLFGNPVLDIVMPRRRSDRGSEASLDLDRLD